jgi:oligoribonuclease
MPESMDLFSYRNTDISTVKELCKRFNPVLSRKIAGDVIQKKLHRVLPDIDDTIAELEWYRDSFLFWDTEDTEHA